MYEYDGKYACSVLYKFKFLSLHLVFSAKNAIAISGTFLVTNAHLHLEWRP